MTIKTVVVLSLFISILLVLLFSCDRGNGEKINNIINNNLQSELTDSLVVEQLIQRSEVFFKETEIKTEPNDSFLKEALEISKRYNLFYQQSRIYNLIGERYRNRAQYGEAMRYHHRALNIAQAINNEQLLTNIYNQIGVVYRRTDDNVMALDMHIKALRLAEQICDTFNISVSINSIGNVNYNLGRYHTAIEYLFQSLELSEKMGNKEGLAINYNNIGECWLKLGSPDSALIYLSRSLDYNSQIGNRFGQSICFNSIGALYITINDYDNAIYYLNRSLRINRKFKDLLQVSISLNKIGEAYIKMGQLAKAHEYLTESYETAIRIGSKLQSEEAALLLSDLYEKSGNTTKALSFYKTASIYKDSILNEKNMFHLTTMEAVLNSENQKERIILLNKEAQKQTSRLNRQRLWLLFFVAFISVLSLVTILLVYQYRLRTKYRMLKHQQRLLRTQMNPHFIFNALSAIQVYILENDIEKSTRFLNNFAKLMRQVLRSSNNDYISLNEETEILKYYIELQKLRFISPFCYNIEIDKDLDPEKVVVPPMITQPFIENAIEHGLMHMDNDGCLSVKFIKAGNQVVIEVDDNGIGIEATKNLLAKDKKHESMATRITQERLDVIRNDFRVKVGLEIIDKKNINPIDHGTIVRIILPLAEMEPSNQNKISKKTI